MKRILIIIVTVFLNSLSVFGQTYNFDFSTGKEGWIGGFADYPIGSEVFYELDFQDTSLPSPLDTTQNSLFITGNNHSDDLFMFIKKKITGLYPNTSYTINFDIEFASKYPTNAVGVGGAPGEGVTMKAGATLNEPDTIHSFGNVRMNIDKNNQTQSGADMGTIGHVGVADTTTVYALKSNNNSSHPFEITTNTTGEIWIIIGTDSGFEATTSLYYNKIAVTFLAILGIDENELANKTTIYPNPSNGNLNFVDEWNTTKIEIYSLNGQLIKTIKNPKKTISLDLLPGVYFIKGYRGNNKRNFIKKIIIKK